MSFTVRLAGAIEVSSSGREILPPPDRAVAILLIGLLATDGEWISRAEAACRLYPDSGPSTARNALRQALFRMRRWLGTEVVESRSGLLRLIPGAIVVRGDEGDPMARVLPSLDHPWIAAIGEVRPPREIVPHLEDFSRAVESVAAVDLDAARSILVGGSALVLNMRLNAAMRLIELTRPVNALSPHAFEHLALCAEVQMHAMSYGDAKANFGKSYRLAVQRRSPAKAFRAACMSAFVYIEAGDMKGAASWLDRGAEIGKNHRELPLLINARAAFLWNSGKVDEAVTLMRASAPSPDAADGSQLLHYWSNFAALASESGDVELAFQADETARSLAKPGIHGAFLQTLELARATGLMNQGRLEDSLLAFETLRERSEVTPPDARAYIEEGYAEALARAGDIRRADEVWSKAEAERLATTARLTPRLAARKARILRATRVERRERGICPTP